MSSARNAHYLATSAHPPSQELHSSRVLNLSLADPASRTERISTTLSLPIRDISIGIPDAAAVPLADKNVPPTLTDVLSLKSKMSKTQKGLDKYDKYARKSLSYIAKARNVYDREKSLRDAANARRVHTAKLLREEREALAAKKKSLRNAHHDLRQVISRKQYDDYVANFAYSTDKQKPALSSNLVPFTGSSLLNLVSHPERDARRYHEKRNIYGGSGYDDIVPNAAVIGSGML
ncbi:hypothetical protein MIND_00210400 [Mycena indigotica]|uniref:Uncharacterized protein n=1 Tax=Mycena indigotica TaxID=2126181 RepID=A0A8H6WD06_9AGAR|nr:uncharacterized protein MIND_00210400 [Mycena indigotica]KAF7311986.1 hypothetical protein MIND_00210400 [Mycena indigotica]